MSLVQLIIGLLAAIREFFSLKKSADDRQAGADAAVIAGHKEEGTALDRTQAAIDEADKKPIEYRD